VILIPFGAWRVREVAERGESKLLFRLVDHMFATAFSKMPEISLRLGRKVTQVILIGDLQGFKMNQLHSFTSE
jgi:hypothetical protein